MEHKFKLPTMFRCIMSSDVHITRLYFWTHTISLLCCSVYDEPFLVYTNNQNLCVCSGICLHCMPVCEMLHGPGKRVLKVSWSFVNLSLRLCKCVVCLWICVCVMCNYLVCVVVQVARPEGKMIQIHFTALLLWVKPLCQNTYTLEPLQITTHKYKSDIKVT